MLLNWAEKSGLKTGWTVAFAISTLPLLAFALSVDMSVVHNETAKR